MRCLWLGNPSQGQTLKPTLMMFELRFIIISQDVRDLGKTYKEIFLKLEVQMD